MLSLQKLAALLFGLDATIAIVMGLRYVRREDFMPYQVKATGRHVAELDPALRGVCLAMLKAVGAGFLGFGLAGLGLAVCLWRGEGIAAYALAASSAALVLPTYFAAASVARLAPDTGAPTRLTLVGGILAGVAFLTFLAA